MRDFEVASSDIDAFDVVPYQLIEGTHFLDRLGNRQNFWLVDMLDFVEHFDELGRFLRSRDTELFQCTNSLIQILLNPRWHDRNYVFSRRFDEIRSSRFFGHDSNCPFGLKKIAAGRNSLDVVRERSDIPGQLIYQSAKTIATVQRAE